MTDLSQQERALSTAADRVVAARADFARMQGALAHDIAALRSQWTGAGAMAFHRLHEAWQERQTRVTAALEALEASLRETERDNASTDQSQAGGFSHHLARLGG
jgi:WXG100 family type VII secretion target